MNKQEIIDLAADFIQSSEYNSISEQVAISEKVVGLKIYEDPIFAFGDAEDALFDELKKPEIIGKHVLTPKEWMPEARTVITFFLPFTDAVREGNKRIKKHPSEEWLHGRIEGQDLLIKLCLFISSKLEEAGYKSLVPVLDKRFFTTTFDEDAAEGPGLAFTSNWSERHAAYISGLGTFGLSKGLITEKGVAGRFGSVITNLDITPDKRPYSDLYEYCSMCGKCGENCPVNAISVEHGKKHKVCSRFLDYTAEKYKPRYGCGKCQIDVPCESRIPE